MGMGTPRGPPRAPCHKPGRRPFRIRGSSPRRLKGGQGGHFVLVALPHSSSHHLPSRFTAAFHSQHRRAGPARSEYRTLLMPPKLLRPAPVLVVVLGLLATPVPASAGTW